MTIGELGAVAGLLAVLMACANAQTVAAGSGLRGTAAAGARARPAPTRSPADSEAGQSAAPASDFLNHRAKFAIVVAAAAVAIVVAVVLDHVLDTGVKVLPPGATLPAGGLS